MYCSSDYLFVVNVICCSSLQVGEEKLVLEIGQAALRRPDSKPYAHDVLLAMALAEVRIA